MRNGKCGCSYSRSLIENVLHVKVFCITFADSFETGFTLIFIEDFLRDISELITFFMLTTDKEEQIRMITSYCECKN